MLGFKSNRVSKSGLWLAVLENCLLENCQNSNAYNNFGNISNYLLFANANMLTYAHKVQQCHAWPKTMRGIALPSVDKILLNIRLKLSVMRQELCKQYKYIYRRLLRLIHRK